MKKATLVVASILLLVFSVAFLGKKVFKLSQVGEHDTMINRTVYTERLNKLMTNWLTYGRGETGLFYIWMDADTNKPKPGFSQVSHSKIPYEADTEEFKIPTALWYMYILTGNKSYLDACRSAVDAWWRHAVDPKTRLSAAGFRWGYGGGVNAVTGEWNDPKIVNWYAIPQVALFGHHEEFVQSCKNAFEKLIIPKETNRANSWYYPAMRGVFIENENASRQNPWDMNYFADFLVTFVLPLWIETKEDAYLDRADAILQQFVSLASPTTSLYPSQIEDSRIKTITSSSASYYATYFVESIVSYAIMYELSGHEGIREKVKQNIDLLIEKQWNADEKWPYERVETFTGIGEGLLNWWTGYCYPYLLLQMYHETGDGRYMDYAKMMAERFADAENRLKSGESYKVNELANAGMVLLNMYQWTGEKRYAEKAVWLGDYIVENMFYPNGWLKFATDTKDGTTADTHMTVWTVQFLLSLIYETFMPDWMMWTHIVGINSPYTLTDGKIEPSGYRIYPAEKKVVVFLNCSSEFAAKIYVHIPYSWGDRGIVYVNGEKTAYESSIITARRYLSFNASIPKGSSEIVIEMESC